MNCLTIKYLNNLTIKIEKDTIYIKTKNLLKPLPKPLPKPIDQLLVEQLQKLPPNPLPKPLPKQYISCLQALHDKLKENI